MIRIVLIIGALFPAMIISAAEVLVGEPPIPFQVEPTALLVRDVDLGELIERPALREATGPNTYLTAAATDPNWQEVFGEPRRIIVSTTFHGVYESLDGGETWVSLGDTGEIEGLHLGDGFYEDVAAVAYDRQDPAVIWIERAQDGGIVAIDRKTGRAVARDPATGRKALEDAYRVPPPVQPPPDAAAQDRRARAANHTSFYLSPWQLEDERLEAHLRFADQHGFTAVVIDFKDDTGRIVYDSSLPLHNDLGAVRPLISAGDLIDAVHDHDLYLIARVVVFKDRELYGYDDHRYALWDSRLNKPWGVYREVTDEESGEARTIQTEYWVDPFSEFVWDYNIAVAGELETLGVDEIQFDYIRTPADGRVWDINYRFQQESPALEDNDPFRDDRVETLSAFLRRAREQITLPLGIDVFGFNGWYRMSYLGQDIALLARYVDVVSPMLYPSHFPREFLGDHSYLEWAEVLYRDGVARGRRITDDHALIRPYIQAFLIGGELQFELPTYTEYLKRQIRGSIEAGGSGFTLWNNSGRYYMVEDGLWFPDGPRVSRDGDSLDSVEDRRR